MAELEELQETHSGTIDLAQPWTIKSVPNETRAKVIAAARREGLTVGRWLERRVRELAAGSPLVSLGPPESDLRTDRLERLVRIAREASPGKDSKALRQARKLAYEQLKALEE